MVGEPLFRMGDDLMGVRLAEEMEPPRGGPGLAGRGWASVGGEGRSQATDHRENDSGKQEREWYVYNKYV